MKTYTEAEYRALEQENIILLKNVEKLELDKRINLKMIGEDLRFRFKMVKILIAMSRRLNLLPDARQAGFFHEDASLNDISDFAEKCLERLKEAHNRDSLIENLGKEKVQWQETAETLAVSVHDARKTFEDIRIWMESLCLALGISLGDLKGNLTSQTISAAIKKLIHEKAQLEADFDAEARSAADESVKAVRLEAEANWLANKLEYYNTPHECELCAKVPGGFGEPCLKPLKEQHCSKCWREAAHKAIEDKND